MSDQPQFALSEFGVEDSRFSILKSLWVDVGGLMEATSTLYDSTQTTSFLQEGDLRFFLLSIDVRAVAGTVVHIDSINRTARINNYAVHPSLKGNGFGRYYSIELMPG